MEAGVNTMLKKVMVKRPTSDCCAPVALVKKPERPFRFLVSLMPFID